MQQAQHIPEIAKSKQPRKQEASRQLLSPLHEYRHSPRNIGDLLRGEFSAWGSPGQSSAPRPPVLLVRLWASFTACAPVIVSALNRRAAYMRLAPEAEARGLHTARISTFDMSAGGAGEGPREELGLNRRAAYMRLAPEAEARGLHTARISTFDMSAGGAGEGPREELGGFTIFAPSDSAFSLLPRSVVSQLQNNTDKLREVVLFHVVPGVLRLEDLTDNGMLSSASPKGRKLRVNVFKHGSDLQDVVTINGARVKRHDMIATNGVIHVIDKVLYPMADLSIMDHLTTCETFTGANVAVTGAGLTPVLEQDGPYTVFLPTTEAFAAIDNATVSSFIENITLLQNVLMYHIVPGAYFSEGLRDGTWLPTLAQEQELQMRVTSDGYTRRLAGVGGKANVIKHDIIATNGVIHVIDTVLRPEKETPFIVISVKKNYCKRMRSEAKSSTSAATSPF
ncbi:transforming growth factor-beta-induced protein ig-h3-like [Penaeus indicus]|uniref:transforming growth factor-beta-induced protein ig-h3-like n=1 Tax=Penaeus indicus TaxID=29960 RepID=UPI00300D94E7